MKVSICIFTGFLICALFLSPGRAVLAEQEISVTGVTEPIKDIILSAETGGKITDIFFNEGEKVQKGRCILQLDSKLEKLEVQRTKLIWESKVEVNSALEKVNTLKPHLESTRALFKSTKSVSKEELEQQELEYILAVAEHKKLEVAELKEKLAYEAALEKLHKLSIRSPINGTLIKRELDEGENCEPRQPLIHLVDTGKCLFICDVEEPIGRRLKERQIVNLIIQTGNETVRKKGTIIFASPVVDSASSLLEVKVEFENSDGLVKPGVSGTIIFTGNP